MANADVLWPIQTALYVALSDAVSCDVWDEVPAGSVMPYVTIGETTSDPHNAHDRFGAISTVTLHIWSTYAGFKEALAIRDDIVVAIDHQPLPISGNHTVSVRHEQTVTMRDPDDDVRHVVVRFAITTEKE